MIQQWRRWAIVIPLSILLGLAFDHFSIPAAWILAAILVAASTAILSGTELVISPRITDVAKAFIAIIAAVPLVTAPPHELLRYGLPGLISAAFTVGFALLGGWVLWRVSGRHASRRAPTDPQPGAPTDPQPGASSGLSPETGVLSLFAGGASIMPFIARELGADYRYVTLTQYLRLLSVSMLMPLVVAASSLHQRDAAEHATDNPPLTWLSLTAIVVIVIIGGPLGRVLRLPAASVLGPMLLTVVLAHFLGPENSIALPEAARDFAYLAVGWMAGGGLSVPALRSFSAHLPITFALIAALIVGCAGLAWIISAWLGVDYVHAFLATNPGGLETALALGDETGAGSMVAAVQIIRLLAVLIAAGWLPRIMGAARRR